MSTTKDAATDNLVKAAMMALFCDMQGMPPIDTQLGKLDAEFERTIGDSGLRSMPEYTLIVEAVNSHASLLARNAELERALEEAALLAACLCDSEGHPKLGTRISEAIKAGKTTK